MKNLKSLLKISEKIKFLLNFEQRFQDIMAMQGQLLSLQNAKRAPFESLCHAEFKVFSQSGEDGILQYLVRESKISPDEKIFVEFGVEDYSEANTKFLLVNNFWRGLIIDGSKRNINKVKKSDLYWKTDLKAIDAWVDRERINQLIGDSGFSGKIGILSIDIDGNDYWVWESIRIVDPVIVVVEWNSVFGPKHSISVPYDSDFSRLRAHYSGLYWGASIKAFEILGRKKGYKLVGSNQLGNNLFFVKQSRLGRLLSVNAKDAYVVSHFRDSRNEKGKLNYLSGEARYKEIADLPMIDVNTNLITSMRQLDQ